MDDNANFARGTLRLRADYELPLGIHAASSHGGSNTLFRRGVFSRCRELRYNTYDIGPGPVFYVYPPGGAILVWYDPAL